MNYIKSPINYIGNKHKLLSQIIPRFPNKINMFVDLFGGSGTVTLNTKAEHYIYNDVNPYVASIFEGLSTIKTEDVLSEIDSIIVKYDLSKTNRDGFEQLRNDYNNGSNDWVTLYTLMCYSFNYQFRFNNNHQYNSSFGKDRSCFSDNQRKNIIEASKRLNNFDIIFAKNNFIDFDFSDFNNDDFVYLDPPYYNSVGNYNDGKRGFEGWTTEHELQLKQLMKSLDNQEVKFAVSNNIAVNKDIYTFSKSNGFKIIELENSYSNSSYQKINKTDKDVEVLITNY